MPIGSRLCLTGALTSWHLSHPNIMQVNTTKSSLVTVVHYSLSNLVRNHFNNPIRYIQDVQCDTSHSRYTTPTTSANCKQGSAYQPCPEIGFLLTQTSSRSLSCFWVRVVSPSQMILACRTRSQLPWQRIYPHHRREQLQKPLTR